MGQLDELLHNWLADPPLQGLMEGLDAHLGDNLYPPTCAPILNNVRVRGGTWATRKGTALFKALPGAGDVRLLGNFYNAAGGRFRIAIRGNNATAVFYDYEEGVDTSFQTTSGGTALCGPNEPYAQGFTLNDRFYWTDRYGPLRRYEPAPSSGNQVRALTQPTAPAVAPNAKPRTYKVLENWQGGGGAAPFGWTESDDTALALEDDSTNTPPPGGGRAVQVDTKTNPKSATISENTAGEALNSSSIAFYVLPTQTATQIQFQVGATAPDEISALIEAPVKDVWSPFFIDTGLLATINFKRFGVIKNAGAADASLSPLYAPGRLNGQYRYRYTHYNSTTGAESGPSPVSNSGVPLDLSTQGKSGQMATIAAFKKSATVDVTTDGDSTTDQIRIYRNGGDVPGLIKDSLGRDVYFLVGTILDKTTKTNGASLAADSDIDVDLATGIVAGDCLVIEKGVASKEEYAVVSVVSTNNITFTQPLLYAHADDATVQVAFLDNVANTAVDTLDLLDENRDSAPSGAKFIAVSPDGRIWAFGYDGKPTGIAVSNRATPERPDDYEVFPSGVDPITRRSLSQGWRFELNGDSTDEAITWGGFYRGRATVFTKTHLYVVTALSQEEWNAFAIQKVLDVGCVAPDTVREINGVLYWVADGARVMRWDGNGLPENISHQRVNETLANAPAASWKRWFAVAHTQPNGRYYSLYLTPDLTGLVAATDMLVTTISSTALTVSWTDNSSDEDGYAVERSADGLTGWVQIGTTAANVTSYADTGLTPDTTYYYRVRPFLGT